MSLPRFTNKIDVLEQIFQLLYPFSPKLKKIIVLFRRHKFETFGNISTAMTLRLGGQKLENFFFLFSTHGARFTWVPGVLFFYFVQLVWESWFDGDKRWNGSLGRIRASQGFFPSDTEVNVAQSARQLFPPIDQFRRNPIFTTSSRVHVPSNFPPS